MVRSTPRKPNAIFLQNKTGKSDAKSVWIGAGGDHPVVVVQSG